MDVSELFPQITPSIPTGSIMWFLQDASDPAPTGWALQAGYTDRIIAVQGGSEDYATEGAQGDWSIPVHSHGTGTGTINGTLAARIGNTNNPHRLGWDRTAIGSYIPDYWIPDIVPYTPSGTNNNRSTYGARIVGVTAENSAVDTWRPAAAVGNLYVKL